MGHCNRHHEQHAPYCPMCLREEVGRLKEDRDRLRAELEQSEKEADSLQDAIEEVCDGPDCTGKGCNSFGHDEDCEISDGVAHLRRYVGGLQARVRELEKKLSVNTCCGHLLWSGECCGNIKSLNDIADEALANSEKE